MNKLTPQEWKIISNVAYRVYYNIGADLVQIVKPPIPRNTLFEIVTDAGRLEQEAQTDEEKSLVEKFYALNWEEREKHMREVFPSDFYE